MVTGGEWHWSNRPNIGIHTQIYIAPDSVNFGAVWCQEEQASFVATGVYSFMNGQNHEAAPTPFSFTTNVVPGLGTLATVMDNVLSGDPGTPAPFTPGTETCTIPWDFRVGTNAWTTNFATLTHNCSLGTNGALNVSKSIASWLCNVTNATVTYSGAPQQPQP
jgi:hypothetical protein